MAGTTQDKLFDAINEGYDAVLAAVEATEARGHRLTKTAIDEARRGEQELIALARKWLDAPTSVFENLEAALDLQARAQHRALELTRDGLTGAGEYGSDLRDALRRVIRANAKAGEATVDAAREAYRRVRGQEAEAGGRRQARATRVPVAVGTNSGGVAVN